MHNMSELFVEFLARGCKLNRFLANRFKMQYWQDLKIQEIQTFNSKFFVPQKHFKTRKQFSFFIKQTFRVNKIFQVHKSFMEKFIQQKGITQGVYREETR